MTPIDRSIHRREQEREGSFVETENKEKDRGDREKNRQKYNTTSVSYK